MCAPTDDEAEPVKDVSPPTIVAVTKASTPTSGGLGCLAGKRSRNGSALIPSGAKEVGVKMVPKNDPVAPTSSSSKCDTPAKKSR